MKKPETNIFDKTIDEAKQGEVFQENPKLTEGEVKGKFYIESYGCAMNFSDSEIVASVLNDANYIPTQEINEADIIFVNTCSIREKAETTIRKRLTEFNKVKKAKPGVVIGVLGCMAERLKDKFLEEEALVDLVAGPDAYRDIPQLVGAAVGGDRSINVQLSREETYADINPLRLDSNGVTAFISIMRGCDNMCAFCVVPYTRGRERSRDAFSIVAEADDLFKKGYREVTLLGQNVDSYKWKNPETDEVVSFAQLMEMVALIHPDLRIRFSTSHPKDITDEVLHTIAKYENICNYIHLPVQSGSTRILKMMNRTYTREWYMERVEAINRIIPECAISSDVITGFCSETDEDHKDTLSIMEFANYSASYMFAYSERPNTYADRNFEDDVPMEVKKARLQEVIRLQNQLSFRHNQADIGKVFKVLIEGDSKKSDKDFKGRNSQNKMIVFPKKGGLKAGDYTFVKVYDATSATLKGKIEG